MPLEISKSFVVRAPRAAAWDFLTDPARVVRCLPGAALTNQIDERTYAGTVTVKVGPVTASYKGTLRFDRLDKDAGTAEVVAAGQDVRGKGGADMRMTSQLIERTPGETEVIVTSQLNIVGVLAQFGRGMIQDVSDQMFQKFADAVRAELETAAAAPESPAAGTSTVPAIGATTSAAADAPSGGRASAPPIDVLALGSTAVARTARRTLRSWLVWPLLIALVAILYWLFRG